MMVSKTIFLVLCSTQITNDVLSIGVSVSVLSEEDVFSGETSIFQNLQETHNESKLSND
jgi:hypothetical protein